MNRDQLIEDFQLLPPPWWSNRWIWAGVALAVAAAAAAWAVRRLWPVKPPAAAPTAPPRDWDAEFLARLRELRSRSETLDGYQLAIECSELLRAYLEAAHSLQIRFQTTREFLAAAAAESRVSEVRRAWLGRYLGFCDLVKFARRGAAPAEREQLLSAAEGFLSATAAEPSIPAPEPEGEGRP